MLRGYSAIYPDHLRCCKGCNGFGYVFLPALKTDEQLGLLEQTPYSVFRVEAVTCPECYGTGKSHKVVR